MKDNFQFKDIVESANDLIIVSKQDPDDITKQIIVYVNPAFTRLTEFTYADAVGKNTKLLELFTDEKTKKQVQKAMMEKIPVRENILLHSKSGKEIWLDLSIIPMKDENGDFTYFASIERDITKEKELLHELEKLSKTDPLTDLFNRREIDELIERELSLYKREGIAFCLIVFDLDNFKTINDTYGHSAGDKILKAVSEILHKQKRPYDSPARMGGDEFCILLSHASLNQAYRFAERLCKSISDINVYEEKQLIKITASVGVTEVEKSDASIISLFNRADEALYSAKAAGRNCVIKWKTEKK